ncbi:YbhB/YbcL family Raf kinase inhibitor-like protein [Testudinibacter sp. TR-2022]|uniref:YbhB/YbcL family Raf kinase inhibitor-like protein n=1 Tax=Testudinibacter sp. TR-2022 TaxID=2585029 RepID=UPI0011198C10|nr:YbhB/YbcL family Raf kinase inhibitor-like protein [Testudinibacter sp. TR-2022]TNH02336.1 YbhB/YbcL family Raf kinase inhibitor-like protein [Pasteurellaceae bacterium Phil31]TNH08902.1 YbhB/YbcL family Raf kinase inhibitor-like protein [Testudinibacter sp. TR-2022]TNH11504.1 YbhB/YbcL family Raf kinase inhibitor-like protein [Testudinibacter sp. TR-2022]TNH14900.1 YbhB/YbcL family Raf kinase inhibitor-like protein [Testudinibacter sp. TR-2022]TNH19188.1 YbhB/YbcL family Raf kinase inhibit
MKVSSSALKNGFFEDKYGKRGTQFSPNGMPNYSIPLEISDAPTGTKSFALVLEDKDAVGAAGYVWIHWLVANLNRTSLPENDSISATDYLQGRNSWSGKLGGLSVEEASFYGGMAPPNADHRYELYVYALDCKLDLAQGFNYNDLHFGMQGHILAQAYLVGCYKK